MALRAPGRVGRSPGGTSIYTGGGSWNFHIREDHPQVERARRDGGWMGPVDREPRGFALDNSTAGVITAQRSDCSSNLLHPPPIRMSMRIQSAPLAASSTSTNRNHAVP